MRNGNGRLLRQQATIIPGAILSILHDAHALYGRGKHLNAVLPEIMIGMALRASRTPLSASTIARRIGFPTETVRRRLPRLVARGAAERHGRLYRSSDEFLNGFDPKVIRRIVRTMIDVGKKLETLLPILGTFFAEHANLAQFCTQ